MKKLIFAVGLTMFSAGLWADCKEFDLQGDWTVFYRDNAFPTSVLAPDRQIIIRYLEDTDGFSVELTDPKWKAWSSDWAHECVDGQTVLLGAIENRGGNASLVMEISRVVEVEDLLARASGEVRLRQINIHFPETFSSAYPAELHKVLSGGGYLASHPGHAHADD